MRSFSGGPARRSCPKDVRSPFFMATRRKTTSTFSSKCPPSRPSRSTGILPQNAWCWLQASFMSPMTARRRRFSSRGPMRMVPPNDHTMASAQVRTHVSSSLPLNRRWMRCRSRAQKNSGSPHLIYGTREFLAAEPPRKVLRGYRTQGAGCDRSSWGFLAGRFPVVIAKGCREGAADRIRRPEAPSSADPAGCSCRRSRTESSGTGREFRSDWSGWPNPHKATAFPGTTRRPESRRNTA